MRWSPLSFCLYTISMTACVVALPIISESIETTDDTSLGIYRRSLQSSTRTVIIFCTVGTTGIILASLLIALAVRRYVLGKKEPPRMVITKEFHVDKGISELIEGEVKEVGGRRFSRYHRGSLKDKGTGRGGMPRTSGDVPQSPPPFTNMIPALPPTIYISSSLPPSHFRSNSISGISPQPTTSPDGYRNSYLEEWYAPGPGPYLATQVNPPDKAGDRDGVPQPQR